MGLRHNCFPDLCILFVHTSSVFDKIIPTTDGKKKRKYRDS